jgi:hypothetical protein
MLGPPLVEVGGFALVLVERGDEEVREPGTLVVLLLPRLLECERVGWLRVEGLILEKEG